MAFLPYFSVRCVRLLRVTTASPFPRSEPFVFRPKSTSYDPSETPTVPPHVGCVGRLFFSIGRPVDRRRRRRRATHLRPSVPSNPASTRARDEPDEPSASSSARRMDGLTNRWMPIRRRRVFFPSTPASRLLDRLLDRFLDRPNERADRRADRPNARADRNLSSTRQRQRANRTEPNRARGSVASPNASTGPILPVRSRRPFGSSVRVIVVYTPIPRYRYKQNKKAKHASFERAIARSFSASSRRERDLDFFHAGGFFGRDRLTYRQTDGMN